MPQGSTSCMGIVWATLPGGQRPNSLFEELLYIPQFSRMAQIPQHNPRVGTHSRKTRRASILNLDLWPRPTISLTPPDQESSFQGTTTLVSAGTELPRRLLPKMTGPKNPLKTCNWKQSMKNQFKTQTSYSNKSAKGTLKNTRTSLVNWQIGKATMT